MIIATVTHSVISFKTPTPIRSKSCWSRGYVLLLQLRGVLLLLAQLTQAGRIVTRLEEDGRPTVSASPVDDRHPRGARRPEEDQLVDQYAHLREFIGADSAVVNWIWELQAHRIPSFQSM